MGTINKQNGNAVAITMMIALFGMISFVTGLSNPMGVIVKDQFGASNFMSQLGNFANFIAYAFMGIPAGMLLKRTGYKKTALLAIAIGFAGVGIQFLSGVAGSFGVYLTGAFVAGFSMCMLNTVVNPMLNTLGGGGKKGNQLIQVGGTFNSLMATIVPVLVGYFIGNAVRPTIQDASPAMYIAMGIFAAAFVALLLVKIPEPLFEAAQAKVKAIVEKSRYSALSFRHFVLGAIGIFIYVGVEVGIPNIANIYMTSGLGIDASIAGTVVGTYWFLMLIGRFVGASLGSFVSSKTMLTFSSVLGLLLVLMAILSPATATVSMPVFKSDLSFGLAEVPVGITFVILCGLCTSVMWGGIFNLAVEGLGKYLAAASGIFMVMVCGGGVLPALQGLVADVASYMASYWVVFGGLCYLLFYALIGSKNVNKTIPV